jgi:hypothetical protein
MWGGVGNSRRLHRNVDSSLTGARDSSADAWQSHYPVFTCGRCSLRVGQMANCAGRHQRRAN